MRSDVAIIIPAWNEAAVIKGVIDKVLKHYSAVVCVNDGSKDETRSEIQRTKAHYVEHPINMGQGAAIQTGIEYARSLQAIRYFVNFDADGQHTISDVGVMIKELEKGDVDIVLGSRFLGATVNMPSLKKALLKLATLFTARTTSLKLTDTHNGLRAFNRTFADNLQLTISDYGHASEILEIIADKHYRYREVPVTIVYSDYSLSKGQSMINAVNIGFDAFLRKLR